MSTGIIMRVVGTAKGDPTPLAGKYVTYYDPNPHTESGEYDGGVLVTCFKPDHAKRFTTVADAMEYWRQGPSCECHRLRDDGQPNRPLTAYTVEIGTEDAMGGLRVGGGQ